MVEQILLGIVAIIILFLYWPGINKMLKQSMQEKNPDWKGVLIPVFIVVSFVFLLIFMSKNA